MSLRDGILSVAKSKDAVEAIFCFIEEIDSHTVLTVGVRKVRSQ